MNDCFWCNVCEHENCLGSQNCKAYISLNSKEGQKLDAEFEDDVEVAMAPVREKYEALLLKRRQQVQEEC